MIKTSYCQLPFGKIHIYKELSSLFFHQNYLKDRSDESNLIFFLLYIIHLSTFCILINYITIDNDFHYKPFSQYGKIQIKKTNAYC
jgi:hypothetical protein